MLKDELRALAALGVKERLAAMERELARLHAEFPEAFASGTAPILLSAELREYGRNGWNGHQQRAVSDHAATARKGWTPERRAKYARTLKRKLKAGGGRLKRAQATPARPDWKTQWYERLEIGGPEPVGVSAAALGTKSANLLTSAAEWIKAGVIKKAGKKGSRGAYAVGKPRPA